MGRRGGPGPDQMRARRRRVASTSKPPIATRLSPIFTHQPESVPVLGSVPVTATVVVGGSAETLSTAVRSRSPQRACTVYWPGPMLGGSVMLKVKLPAPLLVTVPTTMSPILMVTVTLAGQPVPCDRDRAPDLVVARVDDDARRAGHVLGRRRGRRDGQCGHRRDQHGTEHEHSSDHSSPPPWGTTHVRISGSAQSASFVVACRPFPVVVTAAGPPSRRPVGRQDRSAALETGVGVDLVAGLLGHRRPAPVELGGNRSAEATCQPWVGTKVASISSGLTIGCTSDREAVVEAGVDHPGEIEASPSPGAGRDGEVLGVHVVPELELGLEQGPRAVDRRLGQRQRRVERQVGAVGAERQVPGRCCRSPRRAGRSSAPGCAA